ncbi:unnamed protein product [Rhizophagus irregularis]|nr:unnamed protein product [Rhizophagus irregularis]
MLNLAQCYSLGEGTEKNFEKSLSLLWRRNRKNFEKAFHWYQKAAEKDHINAMFHLANIYYDGKGTEKNFEKAFHWFQKAAEKNHTYSMFNLATCYNNGEGIAEKNFEKAFYWSHKAAEDGCTEAMINLAIYYRNGIGTEKNLEKAFYWHKKKAQLNAKNSYEILEWIPYNKLSNINYYDKGGFSKIHKAIWLDGPIFSWNFDIQQWNRQRAMRLFLNT